eukprot:9469674-Pyramimonas_sp.AAC.2
MSPREFYLMRIGSQVSVDPQVRDEFECDTGDALTGAGRFGSDVIRSWTIDSWTGAPWVLVQVGLAYMMRSRISLYRRRRKVESRGKRLATAT